MAVLYDSELPLRKRHHLNIIMATDLNLCLSKKSFIFNRTLTSRSPHEPSGTVNGTATFAPLSQSSHRGAPESLCLLYSETGIFTTAQGLSLRSSKQYIWDIVQCQNTATPEDPTTAPTLRLHFVKRDSEPPAIDYLFLDMKLDQQWRGADVHLCGQDTYDASFELGSLQSAGTFVIRYGVKGPRKDYTSITQYTLVDETADTARKQ